MLFEKKATSKRDKVVTITLNQDERDTLFAEATYMQSGGEKAKGHTNQYVRDAIREKMIRDGKLKYKRSTEKILQPVR